MLLVTFPHVYVRPVLIKSDKVGSRGSHSTVPSFVPVSMGELMYRTYKVNSRGVPLRDKMVNIKPNFLALFFTTYTQVRTPRLLVSSETFQVEVHSKRNGC